MKVNFKKRIKEINFYIKQIPNELPSTKNNELIDSYIRVSIILLCSHFEGALKDIIEVYIKEVNLLEIKCNNLDTKLYAKNIFGNLESKLRDINNIISEFNNYRVALNESRIIDLNYEKFNNTESNPTPEIIIKLFRIFGFDNIIDILNLEIKQLSPSYEQVDFLKTSEKEQLRTFLADKTINKINHILAKSRPNKKQVYKYGFYKFINDLLQTRNKIVHGDSNYTLTKQTVVELKHEIFRLLCGLNQKLEEKIIIMKKNN